MDSLIAFLHLLQELTSPCLAARSAGEKRLWASGEWSHLFAGRGRAYSQGLERAWKRNFRHLFIFDGAAALIELSLLVFGVRYLGGRWQEILAVVQRFQSFLLPGVVLLVLLVLLVLWLWLYNCRRR